MRVAIHQLHYFPWLGYLDKVAKVDKFVILDDVQLTDSSYMYRHNLLTSNGITKFITLPFEKKDYKHKKYRDLKINPDIDWQTIHSNFIKENYKKHPFYGSVIDEVNAIFNKKYIFLIDIAYDSLVLLNKLFNINTKIVFQSTLDYNPDSRNNNLLIELCTSLNADCYISGNGARKYLDKDLFEEKGITVKYQVFKQIQYKQDNCESFTPGLSTLDILFNIGIEDSIGLFYKNLQIEP